MIKHLMSLTVALLLLGSQACRSAYAVEGLVAVASKYSVKETLDNLEVSLKGNGATIFARVDHAANGATVGLPLRPTELLIFGNPIAGTALMQAQQTIGIDLPLKVLAYEDQAGQVWLAYNDPEWFAARHALKPESGKAVAIMAASLKAATAKAAGAP